jgi:nucleotide-binding universal stress UspA family protein
MAERILVPIDLYHESSWRKALPTAVDQARNGGGMLYVMTVVPDIFAGVDWRYAIRGSREGSEEYNLEALVQDALEKLQQLVRDHIPKGLQVECIARHGTIYREILDVAEEIRADLIIMASHRPSLSDYLIGPNTARVVRHARCSVTVLRD